MVLHDGAILELAYLDEDCGCPVEEWLVNGVNLTVHYEPDGSMEVFADTGDWDHTFPLKATTMDAARTEAFAWANALPCSDDAVGAPMGANRTAPPEPTFPKEQR